MCISLLFFDASFNINYPQVFVCVAEKAVPWGGGPPPGGGAPGPAKYDRDHMGYAQKLTSFSRT